MRNIKETEVKIARSKVDRHPTECRCPSNACVPASHQRRCGHETGLHLTPCPKIMAACDFDTKIEIESKVHEPRRWKLHHDNFMPRDMAITYLIRQLKIHVINKWRGT